eukprot:TRINITY_DN7403_c0_g1_i1.p1 TRINITY_DN7403_c0_g1~~TRINITY_DN7403_c0_g1_i1.p1  ORF type:complete len:572 (-),score=106.93 TRINITY_DN7403_c0_g1_i1:145-1860(-)
MFRLVAVLFVCLLVGGGQGGLLGCGDNPLEDGTEMAIHCDVCVGLVDLINHLITLNYTLEQMEGPVIDFCHALIFPHSEHPMCPGLVEVYAPSVLYVLQHTVASPQTICTKLHYCANDTLLTSPPKHGQAIPTVPAEPAAQKVHLREASLQPLPAAAPLRILQVTDMHYDPYYQPGSYADCGDIVCCRADDVNGTRKAGYWGDYHCDLPQHTLENLLQHIASLDPKPDFVVWTGDNPPHDLWMQTQQEQLNATIGAVGMMVKWLQDIPVVPVMGNHESYPANLYYQETYGWLTDALGELWKQWLPADAVKSVQNAGYYTMLIRPGLRVVAMNSQLGYAFNFYTFLDEQPVADQQFAWLEATLAASEQAGERVLLVSHHPPFRYDCMEQYAAQWHTLFDRYQHVIVAQFTGHTHTDLWQVVKDVLTDQIPIGMVYVSPAVTTFSNINPSYRIYEVDPATYTVLDYEQWHMNLTRANAEGTPTWELFYRASQLFSLQDLSPQSWNVVSFDLFTNSTLAALYHEATGTAHAGLTPCDANCMLKEYCQTRCSVHAMYLQCLAHKGAPLFAGEVLN